MQTQVAPLNSILTPGHIYLLSCKLCFTCSISSIISITRYLIYIIVHTNTSVCSSSFSAHCISMCGADPMTATPEKSPHVGNHKINCCGGLTRNKMTCNMQQERCPKQFEQNVRCQSTLAALGRTWVAPFVTGMPQGDIMVISISGQQKSRSLQGARAFESELTKCKSSKEMCTRFNQHSVTTSQPFPHKFGFQIIKKSSVCLSFEHRKVVILNPHVCWLFAGYLMVNHVQRWFPCLVWPSAAPGGRGSAPSAAWQRGSSAQPSLVVLHMGIL